MDDTEIRKRILEILYQEEKKSPGPSRYPLGKLANELGVEQKEMMSHIRFLVGERLVKYPVIGSVSIDHEGIKRVENRDFSFSPTIKSQTIIVTGGQVGQIYQGQNITFDHRVFLDHLEKMIDAHSSASPEEKRNWKHLLGAIGKHPLLIELIRTAIQVVLPPGVTSR